MAESLNMKETKNGFAYAKQRNYYGDFPTAHIDACYQDGSFYDWESGQKVVLQTNAPVRLVARRMDIPEADQSRFYSTAEKVLDRGTVLRFCLSYQPNNLDYFEFTFG